MILLSNFIFLTALTEYDALKSGIKFEIQIQVITRWRIAEWEDWYFVRSVLRSPYSSALHSLQFVRVRSLSVEVDVMDTKIKI